MHPTIEAKGIVVGSYIYNGKRVFVLNNGRESYRVIANEEMKAGKAYNVLGQIAGENIIIPEKVKEIEREKVEKEILANTSLNFATNDEDLKKIETDFIEVAKKIYIAKLLNRYTFVFYHNDADGISSALQLRKFMRANFNADNLPIFSVENAMKVLNQKMSWPLVIILDHGGGIESYPAINMLWRNGIEMVMIDHHPYAKEIEERVLLLNPWKVCEGSKYTTSYLTYEVMKILGNGEEKLAKIGVAGDFSEVMEVNEEDKKRALAVDYIAYHSQNLELIEKMLEDNEMLESIYLEVTDRLQEIELKLQHSVEKKKINGLEVMIVDVEKIKISNTYPRRATIVTVLAKNNEDKACLCIGKTSNLLIFRITKKGKEFVTVSELTKYLDKELHDLIESFGGHEVAGSIKFREGYTHLFLEKLLDYLREKLEKRKKTTFRIKNQKEIL